MNTDLFMALLLVVGTVTCIIAWSYIRPHQHVRRYGRRVPSAAGADGSTVLLSGQDGSPETQPHRPHPDASHHHHAAANHGGAHGGHEGGHASFDGGHGSVDGGHVSVDAGGGHH